MPYFQIPSAGSGGTTTLATTETYVVASQAAMLLLALAEVGDVAVRTDIAKTFILAADGYATLGNWQEFLTPADLVSSVNGATGTVALTTANISEVTNLYFTNARAMAATLTGYSSGAGTVAAADTILQAINKLNGNDALKAPLAAPSFTGTVNMADLTASRAVVTDGSKNLASVAYTNANTASAIVSRDANGDFQSRQIIGNGGSTVPSFIIPRNNSKPALSCSEDTSQGIWFTADGTVEIRQTANVRLLFSGGAQLIGRYIWLSPHDNGTQLFAQGFAHTTNTAQTGNTAGATTDLFSTTLFNGAFTPNKAGYRFQYAGTFAATASADKKITVVVGSTTILDTGDLGVVTAVGWIVEGTLIRTSTTACKAIVTFRCQDNVNGPQLVKYTSVSETMAADLTLKITGKGTSASDVIGEMSKVWIDAD